MTSGLTRHVIVSAALALCVGMALGSAYGGHATRAEMAALPTQTPAIIVRTRTITRTVVVTPTPVPPPSGPQHHITGATHCTDENMCVRPIGYTLRAASPDGECWTFGRQWKRLDVWFHVANGGPYSNSLSSSLFAAAIRGWSVVEADPIAKKGSANITLALDGDRELDGRETFDVPAASHAATIRFHPAWSKAQTFGTWTIRY